MFIAVCDLIASPKLFIILVFDAKSSPDVVDHVLVWGGVVSARRLISREIGVFHVRIHIATGDRRRKGGVFGFGFGYLGSSSPGR